MLGVDANKPMNQQMLDLAKERKKVTFNIEEITTIVNGSKEKTEERKKIEKALYADPLMHMRALYDCNESQRYEMALARALRLMELARKHQWGLDEVQSAVRLIRFEAGMMLHAAMFIPAIQKLGTEEQKEEWLPLAYGLRIVGTYAQTELGHGTNLQGLETTAVYDAMKDEFVLNTPTTTSMKWWPGSLGKTATHAVVLAQLTVKGRACGMQPFIVQLRSLEDHKPLEGIQVGSIGVRMGLNSTDNGFLKMTNVRLPRNRLLSRYSKITPEGDFVSRGSLGSDRANYGTMVLVRKNLCEWVSASLSCACTIAVRYAAVRRQSQPAPNVPEPQIMDYQTQQEKLFPALAACYVYFFAQKSLGEMYDRTNAQMEDGQFDSLPELHAQSSGLKALLTDQAIAWTEVLRRSCGGHGFLRSSGLPDLYMDTLPTVTLEGENTVLYLQTARYLMKQLSSSKPLGDTVAYLLQDTLSYTCPIVTAQDTRDPAKLMLVYKTRAARQLGAVADKLQHLVNSGLSQHEAWNKASIDLVDAAKAHLQLCVVRCGIEGLSSVSVSANTYQVLVQVGALHSLHTLVTNAAHFLETGCITPDHLKLCREQIYVLLDEIRPNAVGLVDAFGIQDALLASCLGREDGDVYTALYEEAMRSPMNKTDVHPAYHKYLGPLLKRGRTAKL